MASNAALENLDSHVQNNQLRLGIGVISLGLVAAVVMSRIGASAPLRLVLLPLFFAGTYGVTAGLFKTCALSAVFGKRRTQSGLQPIADRRELAEIRRRGALVLAVSTVVSVAAATLLAVVR